MKRSKYRVSPGPQLAAVAGQEIVLFSKNSNIFRRIACYT